MKKVNLIVVLVLLFITSAVVVSISQAEPKYVKKETVGKVMMEWNKALGVKCNFCHTSKPSQTYNDLAGKTADKKELSALVHQRIARAMLGSMLYLNQKEGKNYTCNTCHQGKAEVEVK
jgi:cytochrome c peroxidase